MFGWETSQEPPTAYAIDRKLEAQQKKRETLALLTVPRCAIEIARLTNSNKTTAHRRLEELLAEQVVVRRKMPSANGRVWHYVKIELTSLFDIE